MQAENDAAVAALEAVWLPERVHAPGAVPGSPATPYAVVSVSSGAASNYNTAAQHGGKSYRVVAQAVGANVDEVSFAADKVEAAFLDQALAVSGFDCTPAVSEVSSPIIRDPDGGSLLSVTLTYTFNAYPA